MKIELTGKIAVVTGSTDGIGHAAALGLARAGAHVVVNGRSPEKVAAAIAAIKAEVADASLQGVAGDLSDAAGCDRFFAAVPKADILVNNLGIYELKPFFDIPDADWERFFQVNVMSGVRLARAYMQDMMARGWGRVVFISSESGVNIPVEMVHYGFSKTAQLAVARGLAKVAAGTGVTVNAVLPGPTLTPGVEAILKPQMEKTGKSVDEIGAAFVARARPSSLTRRLASTEEVANMIVYACSTQASATTGAALRVEGGIVDTPI
ncbi:MAG: SDR family NAD(P)-dependent oxidoreductase [Ferrovibrionaceae bacterium]